MRKILHILTLAAVMLMVAQMAAFGQASTAPTSTTLASAVTDARANRISVSSATGFVASTGNLDYGVFVEHEFMRITAVSGTIISVQRGQANTVATSHKSGARVWVGQYGNSPSSGTATGGPFVLNRLEGSCTSTAYTYLPIIQVNANAIGGQGMYNCNNGQWVWQTLLDDYGVGMTRFCMPDGLNALGLLTSFGDTAAPFVVGNNQTPVAGTLYYGTVWVPQTTLLTGISILNGTVASTDSYVAMLFRADGTPLANTALAGITASGIGRFQDLAFTGTYMATGPARYWIGIQSAGTTLRFRNINLTPGATTAGLGAFYGMLGSSLTMVYGSIPSALATGGTAPNTAATALPTTLINATAPVACGY